jgi:hypothetical protein
MRSQPYHAVSKVKLFRTQRCCCCCCCVAVAQQPSSPAAHSAALRRLSATPTWPAPPLGPTASPCGPCCQRPPGPCWGATPPPSHRRRGLKGSGTAGVRVRERGGLPEPAPAAAEPCCGWQRQRVTESTPAPPPCFPTPIQTPHPASPPPSNPPTLLPHPTPPPVSAPSWLKVAASHTLTVLSSEPVTNLRSPGDQAQPLQLSLWAWTTERKAYVLFHSRT